MASKQHFQWVELAATLLLALCLPLTASAQSKPKRDVTKDQVITPRKSTAQGREPRQHVGQDHHPGHACQDHAPHHQHVETLDKHLHAPARGSPRDILAGQPAHASHALL